MTPCSASLLWEMYACKMYRDVSRKEDRKRKKDRERETERERERRGERRRTGCSFFMFASMKHLVRDLELYRPTSKCNMTLTTLILPSQIRRIMLCVQICKALSVKAFIHAFHASDRILALTLASIIGAAIRNRIASIAVRGWNL